jgi:hypothetical protein
MMNVDKIDASMDLQAGFREVFDLCGDIYELDSLANAFNGLGYDITLLGNQKIKPDAGISTGK